MWKPIKEIYAQDSLYSDTDRVYASNYQPLLESFGYEIVAQEDIGSYSGDTLVVYHDKATGRYGYLCFGWGSCSGCDALQACDTVQEIEDLRTNLHEAIRWEDNLTAFHEWMNKRDWKGEFYTENYAKEFVEQFNKYWETVNNVSGQAV